MKQVKTKTGGIVNVQEKGDPAPPGAGRPKGSVSFKTLANQILSGKITREDAEGKIVTLTRKEAMVLSMIEDAINSDDPNTRLKAGFGVWDRLEKDPLQVKVEGDNGLDQIPLENRLAALAALESKENGVKSKRNK